ncbi:MAG: ATP-binding cassette domain-containing protein [Rhodospirillaceae bacterium]|nr:MAG: ATP-binding cassette domain-containing protein [Rhodospirillaceae bacterium]
MESSELAIEIRDLYKLYGPKPEAALGHIRSRSMRPEDSGHFVALNNVNLAIEPGKICVIMGLSGSGKSTLLRCINRLIDPTGGQIFIQGHEITHASTKELRRIRSSKISMVFQHFALLPHMTVLDNVAFGLRIAGISRKERRDRAAHALELVGLSGWNDRKPSNLSGGMRQRVGLARALVMDTPVLLMDEPFSALDPLIREEMQQELLRLQNTLNKTIVFVTHDPNEAATLGNRIAILLKGEVVQYGRPLDIVISPANDYVRDFVRGINVFNVLSAGQIVDPARPPVVLTGTSVTSLPISRSTAGPVAVTDGTGRILGVVEKTASLGASAADWQSALSQDYIRIAPDQLVAPFLEELSRNGRPLVVVRDDDSLVGVVTGSSVLKALAANSGVKSKCEEARQQPESKSAMAAEQRAG